MLLKLLTAPITAPLAGFRFVLGQIEDMAEREVYDVDRIREELLLLQLRKNDLRDARQYLDQTVKLRPDYPEAWNNLGMVAAQESQADEAIRNFKHSLSLRPNYAIALTNLGNVYRRQGDVDIEGDAVE